MGIFWVFYFKDFIYLFLERREGREKERETSMCGCPLLGTWPSTQAYALTGNQTGDPLVLRLALKPLSHTSQGNLRFLYSFLLWYNSHSLKFIILTDNTWVVFSSWTFSSLPQRNPIPISSCPSYHSLSSWQPGIYFFSFQICLFWTFCINGIIQYILRFFITTFKNY